jgi:hypothetical protein
VAAGAVVGGAIVAADDESEPTETTTATGTPIGKLPCEPQIMSSKGVTYYLCSSQFYVQAYGDSGLVYMPVSAPR